MLLAVLLAADTNPSPDLGSWSTWVARYAAQFGIFGLVFFDVFITRKVFIPKWAKDDAEAAKDAIIAIRDEEITEKKEDIKELKASLAQLQNLTREQMLPALVRSNQLSADYLQEITRRATEDLAVQRRPSRRARADTGD
jgi:ABC-type sugar transport system ATPase subunit